MGEPTRVVKSGPQGRPAGTAAKRRPLTTRHATTATINNAPPTGRGLQGNGTARSAAHKRLFGAVVLHAVAVLCGRLRFHGGSRSMSHPYWPLFDLEVRTTRLTLRYVDEALAVELAELHGGIHDPATMPFCGPRL